MGWKSHYAVDICKDIGRNTEFCKIDHGVVSGVASGPELVVQTAGKPRRGEIAVISKSVPTAAAAVHAPSAPFTFVEWMSIEGLRRPSWYDISCF